MRASHPAFRGTVGKLLHSTRYGIDRPDGVATDAQVRLVFQGIRPALGCTPDQKNAAINGRGASNGRDVVVYLAHRHAGPALLLVGFNPLTCPVRAWLDVTAIDRGPIFPPVDRRGNIASPG